MSISSRAFMGAITACCITWSLPAFAHAICGNRIFPATLGIDDPGVGDEIALPTLSASPLDPGTAQRGYSASFNYTKTLFPGFGLSVGYGPQWVTTTAAAQGGYGFGDLTTGIKYNFFCAPGWEFMASAGVNVDWGNTNTGGMGNTFNTYSPGLNAGLGFGALPKSLNVLRPFAVTAAIGEDIPGQSWTDGAQNANVLNWGFTIQYSLPYYNSNVGQIDNAFLRRLIPIAEFTFSKPVSNYAPGTNATTGTFQPGVIYAADSWQFALEAIVPLNAASGRGNGVVGELHFYLDDIFPNTLGKPIFGGNKP